MIQILLLFSLSSVSTLAVKRAPTVYQAEEDDNITISWDSHTNTTLTSVWCVFRSVVTKTLYKMTGGVEDSESQHEQFAGRVQIDRDAPRGGPLRLHLSRVTAEDSGTYSCDLTGYHSDSLKRWRLRTSEIFVLDVSRTSDGDKPKGLEGAEGATDQETTARYVVTAFLIFANAGTIVLAIKFLHDGLQRSAAY